MQFSYSPIRPDAFLPYVQTNYSQYPILEHPHNMFFAYGEKPIFTPI